MMHEPSIPLSTKIPFDTQNGIDFSNLIYAVWQGKWFIMFITALAIFAGGYYAFVIVTPVYRSSSIVILEPKSDQIVSFQSVSDGFTGDTPEVNSELEILRARSLMHDVVRHLDLYNDPEFNRTLTPPTSKVVLKSQIKRKLGWSTPPETLSETDFNRRTRDTVVSTLLRKTRIENFRKSTVFRITVQTKKAAKSALIADTIAELYIQQQVGRKIDAAAQATEWLGRRVSELQVELENTETKASDFSASTALISPENLQAQKRQIKDLRERIIAVEQAKLLAELNTKTLENAGDIRTKLEAAKDEQLNRFAQNKTYQVAFDTRFQTILDRAASDHVQISQQLDTLKFSEAELNLQIAKQGQDLISLQQLNREAHAARVLYEHFLSRLKETAAQQGIQKADSRILSPAVIPYKPSEPRKSLIVSMATIFGLVSSLCIILFAELRRTTFRSLTSLERYMGHTGLARLPTLPVKRKQDFIDYLSLNPRDNFASTIRSLRTSLMLNQSNAPKIIAVTSSSADEGCAATALALAYNFANLDQKLLLIDTSQTAGALDDYFGDEPSRGVTSILRGEHAMDQSLHQPDTLGVDVLFANDKSVAANDLFLSKKFGEFLKDMKDRYDLIILNSPDITMTPSSRAVLKHADTVLLNVQWDHTTKREINATHRMLDHVNIPISGVILSGYEPHNINPHNGLIQWIESKFIRESLT